MHLVPKIALGLLFGIFFAFVCLNFKKWDIGTAFALFLISSGLLGIFLVVNLLPRVGDFITTAMFASNAKVEPTAASPALSKIAQGDYEGAVEAYLELAETSEDATPYGEAAKLAAEKLDDPARASEILQDALQNREWGEEDWCYLQFRMVDLLDEHFKDFASARAILESIVEHCPNTRHSANAATRMRELEAAEYQAGLEGGEDTPAEEKPA
jgi:hypothetical protein